MAITSFRWWLLCRGLQVLVLRACSLGGGRGLRLGGSALDVDEGELVFTRLIIASFPNTLIISRYPTRSVILFVQLKQKTGESLTTHTKVLI